MHRCFFSGTSSPALLATHSNNATNSSAPVFFTDTPLPVTNYAPVHAISGPPTSTSASLESLPQEHSAANMQADPAFVELQTVRLTSFSLWLKRYNRAQYTYTETRLVCIQCISYSPPILSSTESQGRSFGATGRSISSRRFDWCSCPQWCT